MKMSGRQLELVMCLERLLRDAVTGRITGISYSTNAQFGLECGFAGEHSGRRLVVIDSNRRVLAVDDPHAETAKRFGTER